MRGAPARVPGRVADRRRRGRRSARSPPECRRGLRGRAGALPARAGAARRGRRRPAARLPRGRRRGADRARRLLGDPRRAAAARHPRRACACSSTPASARTAAASAGTAASGCPSAPTRRASSGGWPSTACAGSASTRAPTSDAARRADAGRDRGRPGRAADRLGGDQLALVARRLPLRPRPRPVRRQIAARDPDLEGRRRRLRPGRRARPPRGARPASSSPRSPPACASSRRARGRRGLLVFAIDTELLGHWWSEGPIWLRGGARRRRGGRGPAADGARGARRARAARAAARRPRPGARGRTCAPGTRPRSPTSPGARGGWSCACCGRSRGGLRGDAAAPRRARAARRAVERLGLPRQPRPGRRLRLPAGHRPRRGGRWRP